MGQPFMIAAFIVLAGWTVFFVIRAILKRRNSQKIKEMQKKEKESAFLKDKGWIPVGMCRNKEMWYRARTDSIHERFTALYIAEAEDFELQARQRAREAYRKEHEHGGE